MTTYTPGAGLPFALPLGTRASGSLAQVSDHFAEAIAPNTAPQSSLQSRLHSPRRPRRRVDADVLQQIEANMPTRDRDVLRRIAEHRYLTTHQVQAFAFTGHASADSAARIARSVLQRLAKLALVRALERRVGGVRAGSAARVWQLAPAGARLLRADGVTHRSQEPSPRFLAHCLAVADVHLGLLSLGTVVPVDAVTVQTEPNAWRRFTGVGGEARWLQPDLAAVIRHSDYDDRWFVEVDLGTESLPTLLRKCGQYEAYRATGIEQAEHGAFPLVLWIFTKAERAERLRAAVLRSPRLTPPLYRFANVATALGVLRESLA